MDNSEGPTDPLLVKDIETSALETGSDTKLKVVDL